MTEDFITRLFSPAHVAALGLPDPDTAMVVIIEGDYDPAKPLIVDVDMNRFIAKCDAMYPGDADPAMLGKVRHNVFVPPSMDKSLFVGQ